MNRKNTAKRLLSLIVSCAMILGMLPITAMALSAIPEEVKEVSAKITLPTKGANPINSGEPGESSLYSVMEVSFYERGALEALEESDTFEAGKTYEIFVTFRPVPGKEIPRTADVSINEIPAEFWSDIADGWGTMKFYIEYTVPEDSAPTEIIDEANVKVEIPYAGDHPDFELESDDPEKYTAEVDYWYKVEEPGYPHLDGESVFEQGCDYRLRIIFRAMPGYEFADDAEFTVNGEITGRYDLSSNIYREKYFNNVQPKNPTYYTVTFNANGHGTAPAAYENLEFNSKISEPADPTADGWVFAGWYKEDTCENEWDFESDKVTDEVTLYAKWLKKITAIDVAVSGYEIGGSTASTAVTTASEGVTIASFQWDDNSGNEFSGNFAADTQYRLEVFFDIADGYSADGLDETGVSIMGEEPTYFNNPWNYDQGDLRIYHYPEKLTVETYTVTFNANGGSGSMTPVTTVGDYILPECEFDAPEGADEFYAWKISSDIGSDIIIEAGKTITVTRDITVTALWTIDAVIEIETGLSLNDLNRLSWMFAFDILNAQGLLDIDEETGEVRNGNGKLLFTVDTDSLVITLADDVSAAEDNIVYELTPEQSEALVLNLGIYISKAALLFPEAKYTVTFNANGGSGSMAPVTTVGDYILPECEFDAPEGADEFYAWKISSDIGSDIIIEAGKTITVTRDITVTALWTIDAVIEIETGLSWNDLNELSWMFALDILNAQGLLDIDDETGEFRNGNGKLLFTVDTDSLVITLADDVSAAEDNIVYELTPEQSEALVLNLGCYISKAALLFPEAELSHTPNADWNKDETHHWHDCTVDGCDEKFDNAKHEDENSDGICDVCEAEMPAEAPEHTPAAEWNKDETHHWHDCTVDGCDEKFDNAEHEDGNSDGFCDECEAEMPAEAPEHTPAADWNKDENGHWHACTVEGCDEKHGYAEHKDGNSDGFCDECGYDVSVPETDTASGKGIGLEGPYMYESDIDQMLTESEAESVFEYGEPVYYLIIDEALDSPLSNYKFVEKLKTKANISKGGDIVNSVKVVKKFVNITDDGADKHCAKIISSCGLESGYYYFLEFEIADKVTVSETDVSGTVEFNRKKSDKNGVHVSKIKDCKIETDFTVFYPNNWNAEGTIKEDRAHIEWDTAYALKFDYDDEVELTFGSPSGGDNEGSFTVDISGQGKLYLCYTTEADERICTANEGAKIDFLTFRGLNDKGVKFNRAGEFRYEMEDGAYAYRVVDGQLIEMPDCYDESEDAFVFSTSILDSYAFSDTQLVNP